MEVGDHELQAFSGAQITGADALLFGRTTYNIWAAFWPTAPEVAAEMGAHITRLPKYVVSKTLRDQDWANTSSSAATSARRSAASRTAAAATSLVYGSADLVAGLLELDLVDELRILVFPVVLGSGKRLFREEADLRQLRLLSIGGHVRAAWCILHLRAAGRTEPPPDDGCVGVHRGPTTRSSPSAPRRTPIACSRPSCSRTSSTRRRRAAALGDREWRRLLDRHDEVGPRRGQALAWRPGQDDRATGSSPASTVPPGRCVAGSRCAAAARRLGIEIRVADPHRRGRGPRRRHRRDRRAHRVAGAVERRRSGRSS